MASDLRSMEISLPRLKRLTFRILQDLPVILDMSHVWPDSNLPQGSSTTPVPCRVFFPNKKSSFTMLATVAFWCMEAQTVLDESKLWLPRVSQAWEERSHSKLGVTFFGGPPFIDAHTSSSSSSIYPNLPGKNLQGRTNELWSSTIRASLSFKKVQGVHHFTINKPYNFVNFQPCLASSWSKHHQFGSSPMHMATRLQRDHLQQWDG